MGECGQVTSPRREIWHRGWFMKVKRYLGIKQMTPNIHWLTLELTTNWSPRLLASMSLTTEDEWIGINPIRDKELWDEFFTESELRHTGRHKTHCMHRQWEKSAGKCSTLNIPARYTPISLQLSCLNQCELHVHKKNQRTYQVLLII